MSSIQNTRFTFILLTKADFIKNLNVTTYIVNCQKTIRASECGIPAEGMTVIAAPTFAELKHSNNANK